VLGWSHKRGDRDGWTYAECEQFSSPKVSLLGWMSEGVHFMLNLGMLWVREFIVEKAGMHVRVRARSSDKRAWESVKQDYKRDRLVGWTTSEEGRGSTWNLIVSIHAWTHIVYECGKEGILKINKWILMFGLGIIFIFIYVYLHSSPYLFVYGDDRVIYYLGADDVTCEPGDA